MSNITLSQIKKFFNVRFIALPLLIAPLLFMQLGCSTHDTSSQDISPYHAFILKEQNISDHSPETIKKYQQMLKGLGHDNIYVIPQNIKSSDLKRMQTKPFPTYTAPDKNAPTTIPLSQINFMQSSIHTLFHDNNFDIITTAYDLKSHETTMRNLPTTKVWKDNTGKIWTLNHRRIVSAILAGNVTMIPVTWASKAEVDANKFEYTTKNHGESIMIYLTNDLGFNVKK